MISWRPSQSADSVSWSRGSGAVARLGTTLRERPELVGAGACALLLGVVAARVAATRSTSSVLLLLAILAPFALMVVRDVRRALIVVIVFDTAFQWDKNFGYDVAAANLGALGGINISVTTIALACLYGMWMAELATRRRSTPRGALRGVMPFLAYVTLTSSSIVVAGDKLLSAYEIALLVQTLLLVLYIAATVTTREDVRLIAVAIVFCLFVESLVALVTPFLGNTNLVGLKTYAAAGGSGESARFGGTLGFANTAAAFFALLMAPTLALLATPCTRFIKRIAAVAVATSALALVLTFSRGGWIAFVVSFCFLVVVGARRGWFSPKIPVLAAIVLTLLLVPFSGQIAARVTGNDQGAAQSRIPLMHLASSVIRDHPVLGVGLNNLGIVIPRYAGPQFDRAWIYTVHDKYLLVWAESGPAALAAFVWLLLSMLQRGWRIWRGGDPLFAPLALGLTAGVIGQMVHMTVDIFQSRPLVQSLWLVGALLIAMENVAGRAGGPTRGPWSRADEVTAREREPVPA